RVPSWAAREMAVKVNGKQAATGRPGSYVALDRTWSSGDTIAFKLPADLRVEKYTGVDQIPGHDRFAILYGPILLAAVGSSQIRLLGAEANRPESLVGLLSPTPGRPLHYTVKNNPGIEYMPYWQIDQQPFNCFPGVTRNV
ncbi:MAG: glycoside hydrolase family 127 protein, partial [Acidobacteriota bacterium]